MEGLIEIVLFLAERNLAFRGSNEIFGSPHNGNFLGVFGLLAKGDPVLDKLQCGTNLSNPKLTKDLQNKLINLIAKEVKKVLLTQLTQAIYFAVIFDCTPNILFRE